MPISDEVIELAPVKKTKKKLIVVFVAMGVLLALAVTFLVMYLIKPSVEKDNSVVKDVTIESTGLFSMNGTDYYASIGNEYTVYADITVENGASPNIAWEVTPREAVTEIKSSSGDGERAYFTFVPNVGHHNKDVSIKARSASNTSKYKEVKFKVVNQGAESIKLTDFYAQGNAANKEQIKNDEIRVPHYAVDVNNKNYNVLFDQYGKYNESTGEYAKMSITKTADGLESNAVTVTSDNSSVVTVIGSSHEGFIFRARGKGVANIKIKANINNPDAPQNVEKTLKINVQSSTELGYIEKIYLFNTAVVDGDFIESVLDKTRTQLDVAALTELVKNDPDLVMDPKEITFPYNTTYDDIFSHVLISPITIQYDSAAKTIKNNWYKSLSVKSSNDQAMKVTTDKNGAVSLAATGLASTAQSATTCKLTFSDTTAGNIKVDNEVNVRVVAQNESGKLSVKVGTSDFAEDAVAPVAPNVSATLSAIYNIRMSGKTDVNEVVDKKYLTGTYMLDFDPAIMEVRVAGSTGASLTPNKVYELTSEAMKIERKGADTSSITNFEGTVKFTVKIKDGVKDGTYTLKFIKVGTSVSGGEDWNGKDKSDRTWEKTASFEVTAKATKAFFIDTEDATALVTKNNAFAGKFVPSAGENPTSATVYVQNQQQGTTWNKENFFNIAELVTTDVTRFKTQVKIVTYNQNVFSATGNVLTFRGLAPDDASLPCAEFDISVFDIENKEIGVLKVKVYVIDAITAFEEIGEQSVEYDKDNKKGTGLAYADLVKVKRTLNTKFETYNNYTINLYFGHISEDTKLVPEEDTVNKITYYKHNGVRLYQIQSFVIKPVTDLYAYSYNNNVNVADLRVEFSVNEKDFYHVEGGDSSVLVTSVMTCKFMRLADGVAAFTSSDYSEQSRIKDNKYSVNQGSQVDLYISSTVEIINNESDKEIVYVMRYNDGAFAVKSYIQIPTGISATGDAAGKGDNTFYTVRFEAPRISSGSTTGEDNYNLTLFCGSTPTTVVLTVQNLARSIVSVGVYEDMQCTNEISSSVLEFGKYIGKSGVYSKTVYVKIVYEAVPASDAHATQSTSWQYYEAAVLTLPDYLTASGSGVAGKNNGVYHLAPTDPDIYNADYGVGGGAVITCEIKLKTTASEHDSDYLTIHRANKIDEQLIKQSVKVGTGLANITVSDDNGHGCIINAGNSGTVEYTFELQNNGATQPSYKLNLNYGALTASEYPGIAYNNKSETEFTLSYTAINGLTVSDFSHGDNPYILIGIASDVKTLIGTYSFVFTDKSGRASSGNTFTLNVKITVTMDIFALDFGDAGSEYRIKTTGNQGGAVSDVASLPITVLYNGGDTTVQPTAQIIKNNNVADIVTKTADGSYIEYTGGDIYIRRSGTDGEGYTLYVKNSIITAADYYVRLKYGDITPVYRAIKIETNSHTLYLADDNNVSVTETGGEKSALVSVSQDNVAFKLAAVVKNDGTQEVVAGKNVTYAIYTDKTFNTVASDVTFDSTSGEIKINPSAVTNTVYYKASYTDVGGKGDTQEIVIKFTYRVEISSVQLQGLDGNTFAADDKLITLYIGGNKYTELDLSSYIKPINVFGKDFGNAVTNSVRLANQSDASKLTVNGLKLIPESLTGTAGVPIIITSQYFGSEKEYRCNVAVKSITSLALTTVSGKINVADADSSVTVSSNVKDYAGFVVEYTLTSDKTGLDITGAGYEKTVALSTRSAASLGTYTLTATVKYKLASGSSLTLSGGEFMYEAIYSLTVDCDYAPQFGLVYNSAETVLPYDTTDATKHTVKDASKYAVNVIGATHGDANARYSASATNVITVGTFTGDSGAVTINDNESGEFNVTLTAVVYGKTFTVTQKYFFSYGADASAKLYGKVDGQEYTELTASDGQTVINQNIDFVNGKPYTFKYEISDVDIANSVVDIIVNGNVTVGEMVKANGKCYVEITADKETTLQVGGIVKVGTRTVYTESFTVRLTATAPVFEITASRDKILPAETATFTAGVKNNGFAGNIAVQYLIISGGDMAINSASGVLTAGSNITVNTLVTVRATITVTDSVFNGVYTVEKSIIVLGVPLPTVAWRNPTVDIEIGTDGAIEFVADTDYIFDGHKVLSDGITYDYVANYAITVSSASGLTANDYKLANGKLEIIGTNTTLAGGKITLCLTATVTSDVNKGAIATDYIDVVIAPQARSVAGATVSNGVGVYDVRDAVKPNTTSTTGHFIADSEANDYTVTSVVVVNDADKQFVQASGARLAVVRNITELGKTIDLDVTIVMTKGVYAGKEMTCRTSVAVVNPTVTNSAATWNGDLLAYNQVTVKDCINIAEVADGVAVTRIAVTAIEEDQASAFTVINNNTVNPVITVDRAFNTSIGADGSDSAIKVAYVITLSNGRVYYGEGQISVADVRVDVTAKVGVQNIALDKDFADNDITSVLINAGEVAALATSASNGFDVRVKSVEITDEQGSATDYLTGLANGDSAIFTAAVISSDKTCNVTVKTDVCGTEYIIKFKVNIVAPATSSAYDVGNTENTDFAVGEGGEVISKWANNGGSAYKYGYSVTITAPAGNLSDYLVSATLHLTEGGATLDTLNLNGQSDTLYFNNANGSSHSHNVNTSNFVLKLVFKTTAAVKRCNIEATYRAYNKSSLGSAQNFTGWYRFEVVGKVTVTLDTNAHGDDSATCEKSTVDVNYKGLYGNLPVASRTGYDFLGWYTAAVGGDKIVFVTGESGNTMVTNRESHTLYAHWAEKTYTVALDANADGDSVTDSAASVTVKFGGTYSTLPKNPKRVGYEFLGWFTAANGGDRVDGGDEVTAMPHTRLYAHWTPVIYTVTLNANGGSIAGLDSFEFTVPFGTEFTRHVSVMPTRDGYTFNGWRTAASGGDSVGASITVTGNTVIYADWSVIPQKTVEVTFDTHVVGMTVAGKTVNYGGTYGELPTAGERAGYTFLGWFTAQTDGELVTENTIVPDVTSVELHAHWQVNVYTVTFNAAGGDIAGVETIALNVAYNEAVTLFNPVKAGYVFDGWFDADDNKVGMGGDAYTVTDDVTLTAKWSQYSVSFDLNYDGAAETIDDKIYAVGAKYGADLPVPTSARDGFEFKGWCTDKNNAAATAVTADDVVEGNVTLYAVWEAVTVEP